MASVTLALCISAFILPIVQSLPVPSNESSQQSTNNSSSAVAFKPVDLGNGMWQLSTGNYYMDVCPVDWFRAAQTCKRLNSDMLVIHNTQENYELTALYQYNYAKKDFSQCEFTVPSRNGHPFKGFWTGLVRVTQNTFGWMNGEVYGPYSNWINGQPDNDGGNGFQNCMVVWVEDQDDNMPSGGWDDMWCVNAPKGFDKHAQLATVCSS